MLSQITQYQYKQCLLPLSHNFPGAILVDEMKFTPGVEFDRSTMSNGAFPTWIAMIQEIMSLWCFFQPFQGNWHQSLGCFLSKGNVKGSELTKLILEGIELTEDAGL